MPVTMMMIIDKVKTVGATADRAGTMLSLCRDIDATSQQQILPGIHGRGFHGLDQVERFLVV
ncbi:hypothetical protein XBP1_2940083 [Xenorhabdus bovienii str. puntauvense]|uniref:Uncharacterized protein n=1 Tax=Xenorhabdus bovienii str. puntauvense TaxID=1398201 RepID=A0A077NIB4_XENBV|nr:hypothetical protein XBP1_2940083 [Xenorhabdus bovienii str. puntauvense]